MIDKYLFPLLDWEGKAPVKSVCHFPDMLVTLQIRLSDLGNVCDEVFCDVDWIYCGGCFM